MKRLFIILLILATLGCAPIGTGSYSKQIEGIWVYNQESDKPEYSIIEYQPNGDKCEISFEASLDSGITVILYWNKWRIEGDTIYTTMYATNGGLPLGLEINDRILEINENYFVAVIDNFPESAPWDSELHLRSLDAEYGQVCDLVRGAFHEDESLDGEKLNKSKHSGGKKAAGV